MSFAISYACDRCKAEIPTETDVFEIRSSGDGGMTSRHGEFCHDCFKVVSAAISEAWAL